MNPKITSCGVIVYEVNVYVTFGDEVIDELSHLGCTRLFYECHANRISHIT